MSKTLLNGVNELLKKAGVLDEDAGLLTSLTDSARQTFIDGAVQAINEAMDQMYGYCKLSKPKIMREATITLVENERSYALHSSLVTLRCEFPLIDSSNNQFITIIEDGYRDIIVSDIEQDDTGLPDVAAISPIDGRLILNRLPRAEDAGRIYKYRYDKDTEMDEADDCFPFNNAVFRGLIPAATQLWRLNHQKEFDAALFKGSMARAVKFLRMLPQRDSWLSSTGTNSTDPMHDSAIQ